MASRRGSEPLAQHARAGAALVLFVVDARARGAVLREPLVKRVPHAEQFGLGRDAAIGAPIACTYHCLSEVVLERLLKRFDACLLGEAVDAGVFVALLYWHLPCRNRL